MLFVILGHDAPNTLSMRSAARPSHLDYLKTLDAEKRLYLAGPRPKAETPDSSGFFGSLIIAEFSDLNAAKIWAENDPYFLAGVFEHVDVQPFIKVFGA